MEPFFDAADLAEIDRLTFFGDLSAEDRCEYCGELACGPCCPNNDPWQHAEPQ